MKLLICDDEKLARERLIRLVAALPNCEVIAQAEQGVQALEYVQLYQPDVVLLDIQMPGMNGLEVAIRLSQLAHPPGIIFCTAYEEYAIAAFNTQAVGYLLKPVRQEALQAALLSAQRLNQAQLKTLEQLTQATALDAQLTPPVIAERTHLSARTHRGIELVALQDIRLLKAEQKYVVAKTAEQEILIDDSLKELEQMFSHSFIRVHRNALVAMRHITGLKWIRAGYYAVQLDGLSETVPVSRRYLSQVRKKLRNL